MTDTKNEKPTCGLTIDLTGLSTKHKLDIVNMTLNNQDRIDALQALLEVVQEAALERGYDQGFDEGLDQNRSLSHRIKKQ